MSAEHADRQALIAEANRDFDYHLSDSGKPSFDLNSYLMDVDRVRRYGLATERQLREKMQTAALPHLTEITDVLVPEIDAFDRGNNIEGVRQNLGILKLTGADQVEGISDLVSIYTTQHPEIREYLDSLDLPEEDDDNQISPDQPVVEARALIPGIKVKRGGLFGLGKLDPRDASYQEQQARWDQSYGRTPNLVQRLETADEGTRRTYAFYAGAVLGLRFHLDPASTSELFAQVPFREQVLTEAGQFMSRTELVALRGNLARILEAEPGEFEEMQFAIISELGRRHPVNYAESSAPAPDPETRFNEALAYWQEFTQTFPNWDKDVNTDLGVQVEYAAAVGNYISSEFLVNPESAVETLDGIRPALRDQVITDALSRLKDTEIDALVKEVNKTAPRDSDLRQKIPPVAEWILRDRNPDGRPEVMRRMVEGLDESEDTARPAGRRERVRPGNPRRGRGRREERRETREPARRAETGIEVEDELDLDPTPPDLDQAARDPDYYKNRFRAARGRYGRLVERYTDPLTGFATIEEAIANDETAYKRFVKRVGEAFATQFYVNPEQSVNPILQLTPDLQAEVFRKAILGVVDGDIERIYHLVGDKIEGYEATQLVDIAVEEINRRHDLRVAEVEEIPIPGPGGESEVIPAERREDVEAIIEGLREAYQKMDEEREKNPFGLDSGAHLDRVSDLQYSLSHALGLREDERYMSQGALEREELTLSDQILNVDSLLRTAAQEGNYEQVSSMLRKLYSGSTADVQTALSNLIADDSGALALAFGGERGKLLERFNRAFEDAAGVEGRGLDGEMETYLEGIEVANEFRNLVRSGDSPEQVVEAFKARNKAVMEAHNLQIAPLRKIVDYQMGLASDVGMEIKYDYGN